MIKVFGWTAIALGLATLAVFPKGRIDSEGAFLVSCTTKQMYVNASDLAEAGVPPGFYNSETFVEKFFEYAKVQYMEELAGNPFMGFGLSLFESLQPAMTTLMETTITEVCEGKSGSELSVAAVADSLSRLANP